MKRCFYKAAALGVALLCIASCQLAKLKRVRVAPEPVKVTVMEVNSSIGVNKHSYVGTVEAAKEAMVNAVHGGTVMSVSARQGQSVAAGQELSEISSPMIESSLSLVESTLRQARDGYDRASKVYQSGSISQVQMVELETKLKQAESSYAAAKASKEECVVRAPFTGAIADVFVHQGEHVTMGKPLFSIIDASALEVVISVPEGEMAGIRENDGATVVFPSLGEVSVRARVKSKGMTANVLSHSYKCSLLLGRVPENLMCGMVSKVYLDSDKLEGIVIPSDAIKLSSEGKYVWVVNDGDRVCRRMIEVGLYSGKGVVINAGLENGDRLIVEGMDKVSEGMTVKIGGVKAEY